jgi:hypothetical protein
LETSIENRLFATRPASAQPANPTAGTAPDFMLILLPEFALTTVK